MCQLNVLLAKLYGSMYTDPVGLKALLARAFDYRRIEAKLWYASALHEFSRGLTVRKATLQPEDSLHLQELEQRCSVCSDQRNPSPRRQAGSTDISEDLVL